ncbi:uncharacterized protein isoform X2 [Choristoneura fumiferana]|uniref:uncharacterized protein isoform X2 n=1 Tax=Choristoneura fumiferana TaxID=7141 RepID=UPI003D156DB0
MKNIKFLSERVNKKLALLKQREGFKVAVLYVLIYIWDQIDLEKSKGANYTLEEETEKFNNAIDPTDELLNLKVENGDAKILMQRNGRRWMPPQRLNESTRYSKAHHDPWNNRYRIMELMKQAIYQARNKMIIMQTLRDEFRNQSSYKIGYLIAKTDFATKTLAAFAFRAMRACSSKRQLIENPTKRQYRFLEILYTAEKQMHLWFEVDLLIELYWTNHLIAQRATNKRKIINVKRWNERFVN